MKLRPIALVTGAGSGIGAATTQRLLEKGYTVYAADLSGDALASLGDHEGLTPMETDVSDADRLEELVAQIRRDCAALDAVVANAAVSFTGGLAVTTPEIWDRIMQVNLRGVFLLARATVDLLSTSSRASFVATASELGIVGQKGLSAYGAAKAGVIHLMKVLAIEYAPQGIRFNAMAPGPTLTPMMQREQERLGETVEAAATGVPLARLARPAEIAAVIEFLLSPDASYVTGATYVADGGFTAT